MLSVVGILLICLSSTALGLYYGNRCARRISLLLELKRCLTALRSDIDYARYTLSGAFMRLYERGGQFSSFFHDLSCSVEQNKGLLQSWQDALDKTDLNPADAEIIKSLGQDLGHIDKEAQLQAIDHCIQMIDHNIDNLSIQSQKEKKLYRELGVLGGLLIVVVLI